MTIRGVSGAPAPELIPTESPSKKPAAVDFSKVLVDAIGDASKAEKAATQASEAFAHGQGGIHEVMIAAEKASISLRFAVTLKNRALEAYRELMNTPV